MAETGDRTDPIQAFRFTVSFDDLPVAGFTEVSGLDVEIEILEHVEGGLNDHVHRLPTRAKTGTLTLKRGIVDRRVWDWCWDTVQGRIVRRGGTISVRPPDGGAPVLAFEFRRALPGRWIGPTLDATSSAVDRKSCRGRVCQSVEVPGVPVT